jgi:hypothetical protein
MRSPTVYRLRNWKSGQGAKGCRAVEREKKLEIEFTGIPQTLPQIVLKFRYVDNFSKLDMVIPTLVCYKLQRTPLSNYCRLAALRITLFPVLFLSIRRISTWVKVIRASFLFVTILFSIYNPMYCIKGPITVATLSKTWTVFARSNAGIVGSNPTQSMDVSIVCIYSVFR